MLDNFAGMIQTALASHPLAAPLLFVGAHVILAIFLLPCSPMTLMAGALWGGVNGLVISTFAAIASSAVTFLLSRSFLHGKIEKFLTHRYPKMANLLIQATTHDWKLIAAAQLNPLIPASTMGYVFGLSRITFTRYLLFSGIFMLPLQTLFVMTGHSVTNLITSGGRWEGVLALLFLVAIAPLIGKRIFRKLLSIV